MKDNSAYAMQNYYDSQVHVYFRNLFFNISACKI